MLPPWFPAGLDDWEQIAKLPSVDEIACDPYWERGDSEEKIRLNYAQISKRIASIAKTFGKEAQMWIKNYQIESGRENDWYGKDMVLTEEQAKQLADFVSDNHPYNARDIECLVAMALLHGNKVVINADW